MKPYPHHYAASASARAIGSVTITAPALSPIDTAPPPEFDGPEGTWSPEVLLCAALADCFILTFRAVARAAHFNWIALDCRVTGVLERAGDTTQFTRFATAARLTTHRCGDHAKGQALLEQAEHGCLIANSLRGERALSTDIVSAEAAGDRRDYVKESVREGTRQCASRREPEPQPAIGEVS